MTKHPAAPASSNSTSRAPSSGAVTIVCNGEPRSLGPATTLAALVDELGLPPRQIAVEVNLQLIPRGQHAQHVLADGDRVEIVSLVGGG
ncbi:MAG TPA: sulfur carrier protein ThiS [Pirellulales bacterium]|nr:sulfur carrier protein ThiS [Pirellulales bacterium]